MKSVIRPRVAFHRRWEERVHKRNGSMSCMWTKSSRSSVNGSCVEIQADGNGNIKVRDSKLGDESPVLVFNAQEWDAFVEGVRDGEMTSQL